MAGTRIGGLKTAKTVKKRYGKNFYKRMGSIGGKLSHKGGFGANPDLARKAGSIGGRVGKIHVGNPAKCAHETETKFKVEDRLYARCDKCRAVRKLSFKIKVRG